MNDLLRLMIEKPLSLTTLICLSLALVFYLGVVYTNLRHMRTSMVTKKDLELGFANFRVYIHETFVTKEQYERESKRLKP